MKQVLAPLITNIEAMPGTQLAWLESTEIAEAARPGQFVTIRCGEDSYLRRPLSIHQVDGNRFALLYDVVGKGTRWMAHMQAGEKLDVFGPLGNGYTIDPGSQNLLVVAGGIGIAPLRFLVDTALGQGKKVTLITGARSSFHLFPVNPRPGLFNDGMMPSSFCSVNATDDGSEGFKGPATGLIPAYLDCGDQIFACGPLEMYRSMAKMTELEGKPVQVSLETAMGCGIGICYSCTIKTAKGLKQVCKDGPVFDLADIIWENLEGIGGAGRRRE